MSSFTAHHVQRLILDTLTESHDEEVSVSKHQTRDAQEYYKLLVGLKSPLEASAVNNTLTELSDRESRVASLGQDPDRDAIKSLVETRVLIGVYSQALDTCLQEAREADEEAEWWSGIERSRQSIAWYLLATLPERIKRSVETIIHELRSHNIPLRPSSFTPQSIRQLFPQTLRPTALSTAFFPHLRYQPHVLLTSPLELIRQECRIRQKMLIELRNERAEQLGQLLNLRNQIETAVKSQSGLHEISADLSRVLTGNETAPAPLNLTSSLKLLAFTQLPNHREAHQSRLSLLKKPSRLTRIWPRLVFVPPLALLLFRYVYGSRQSIAENALKAYETAKGFWFGYVVEPIRSILDTVRTGGDESARLVSAEGVRADLDSLERMALDLSKEKYRLNQQQLDALAEQIRRGDLTPVLQIYENDMKTPLRSAITGSLVRSLLVQIQKAKVDLDQALSGIDRLLKSQELTFAFVGVSPSIAILYGVWSYTRSIWVGGRGNSKLGGRRRREATWSAIRRVERLLVSSPDEGPSEAAADRGLLATSSIPPLTSGLLVISVASLRTYAEKYLPPHSLLREGFLEDIADLESPDLSRFEKQQVVARMWRSWGSVLGWNRLGKIGST